MTRIEEHVGRVLRAVAIVLLALILVLMVANVLNRFANVAALDWNDEIIELMLAWMIFLASAEVWRMNQHFAVDLVPTMIEGTALAKPFKIFIALGCLVFVAIFTYRSFDLFQRASDVSPYFSLPRKLWLGSMPCSGALMVLFSLRQIATLVLTPSQRNVAKDRGGIGSGSEASPTA